MHGQTSGNMENAGTDSGHGAHKNNTDESWSAFREIRNKIKSAISKARRCLLVNALSSKRSKNVWKIIHRVLHPNSKPLRADPDKINKHFISTATRTLGSKPDDTSDLLNFVQSLSITGDDSFQFSLRHVGYKEVQTQIKQLRTDCSTGYDQIPVKYVKLCRDYLAGPLSLHILLTNASIRHLSLASGKPPEFHQSLKRIIQNARMTTVQYLYYQYYQRYLNA